MGFEMDSTENAQDLKIATSNLSEKVRGFPKGSGVYLMMSAQKKILYIGKAKDLHARVGHYFHKTAPSRVQLLMRNVQDIEYVLTKTELEAYLLEASLIKKHRPRYNVRLKDDKAYPYIRVSVKDKFPRLYLSRRVKKDGALYFGPYSHGSAVQGTIRFLNRTFQLRDCKDTVFRSRSRPCITHQMGHCEAPCVHLVTKEEYTGKLKLAISFLNGNDRHILKGMEEEMQKAARLERFELAARLRDGFLSAQHIFEKQPLITKKVMGNQDVIGFYQQDNQVMMGMLHIRNGRLIGKRSYFFLNTYDMQESVYHLLLSFVNQYYEEHLIPNEVLVPVQLPDEQLQWLSKILTAKVASHHQEKKKKQVQVRFPMDTEGSHLLQEVDRLVHDAFKERVSAEQKIEAGLLEIQKRFHLPQKPLRMECFDISHFQGKETVASGVVFVAGVPSKSEYRKYRIRGVQESDDYASMKEVLQRRFSSQTDKREPPQLLVIDGGKGQLSVAKKVLEELKLKIPVVSLAKSHSQGEFQDEPSYSGERFFLPGRKNPVIFRSGSAAFQILVSLRDEAHRFALFYHRALREKAVFE